MKIDRKNPTISQLLDKGHIGSGLLKKLLRTWAAEVLGRDVTNPIEINHAWEYCGFLPLTPLRRTESKFYVIMDMYTDNADLILDISGGEKTVVEAVMRRDTDNVNEGQSNLDKVMLKAFLRRSLVQDFEAKGSSLYSQSVFESIVSEGIQDYDIDHLSALINVIICPSLCWKKVFPAKTSEAEDRDKIIHELNYTRSILGKNTFLSVHDLETKSEELESYLKELAYFAFEGQIDNDES